MKKLITATLFLILVKSVAFSWNSREYFDVSYIVNPYNDNEIIVGDDKKTHYFLVDLTTGANKEFNFVPHYGSDCYGAIINDESSRIAFMVDSKLMIYNFRTWEPLQEIVTIFNFSDSRLQKAFSSNGEMVYFFDKSTMRFASYSLGTGAIVENFQIDVNPSFYSSAYLNPEGEEYCLHKGDSLEFFDFDSKESKRKIPFVEGCTNVSFRNNGTKIIYTKGDKIAIAESETGKIEFTHTAIDQFTYFEFSKDLNYLTYGFDGYSVLFDIEADTIISRTNGQTYLPGTPNYYYMCSDGERALTFEPETFYCGTHADMPWAATIYFIYNRSSERRITSVPAGYVCYPEKIVIGKDNLLMSVYGKSQYPDENINTFNALVNDEGGFVKYIYSDYIPRAFSDDLTSLILTENGNVCKYDIEGDSVETIINTELGNISYLHFSGFDKLIVCNNTKIKTYSYPELQLISQADIKTENMKIMKMVANEFGRIRYFTQDNSFFNFDPANGESDEIELGDALMGYDIEDISADGTNLLLKTSYDTVIVYDNFFSTHYYRGISQYPKAWEMQKRGLYGNSDAIWYSYIHDPVYQTYSFYVINYFDGSKENLVGNAPPFVSRKGYFYATTQCPFYYYYYETPVPVDILRSVEGNNEKIRTYAYPNPADDFIEIQFDNIEQIGIFDEISAYNVRGEEFLLMPDSATGKLRFNVAGLAPGMYYIFLKNEIVKFIKK